MAMRLPPIHPDDKLIDIKITWSAASQLNMALRDMIEELQSKIARAIDGEGITAMWNCPDTELYLEGCQEQLDRLIIADGYMQQAWHDNSLPITSDGDMY